MNSILSRDYVQQFQTQPFSNFQEDLSSSQSSINTEKNDTKYCINYYNQQQCKEQNNIFYDDNINLTSSNKYIVTSSPNAKRQLIFSRPYKNKMYKLKLQSKTQPQKTGEASIIQTQKDIQCQEIFDDNNQLLQNQGNSDQTETQIGSESLQSLPVSSTYLQSMKDKQIQIQLDNEINNLYQQQSQNQNISQKIETPSQISPNQSMKALSNSSHQIIQQIKPYNLQFASSQGTIQNNNIPLSTKHQGFILSQHRSAHEISTRKNSLQGSDFKQNLNNTQKTEEIQCQHKIKISGERQIRVEQQIHKNKQLLLPNQGTQGSFQLIENQQQLQYCQSVSNVNEISKTQKLQAKNDQQTKILFDKTIINFQQQKIMSSFKYKSFASNINSPNHQSMHLSQDFFNSQQTTSLEKQPLNTRGYFTPKLINEGSQSEQIFMKNDQDSFQEKTKDPAQKIFLLEGYSQNIHLKQNLNNQSEILLKSQKSKQLTSPFIQEFNKQRVLSGPSTPANTSSRNTNTSTNNSLQIIKNPSNRIASANTYNRKYFSSHINGETFANLQSIEGLNTLLQEDQVPQIYNQLQSELQLQLANQQYYCNLQQQNVLQNKQNLQNVSCHQLQNKNCFQKMKTENKTQGFNVLDYINQINSKQQSVSTPVSQQSTQFVGKHFKIQQSQTPKAQKNFQVLYKICNKNILNAGLKESKPSFYQLNTNIQKKQ